MQQYDVEKLQGAFRGKKRYEGYTLSRLAEDSGYGLTTVARVLELGRGREELVDRVARALGFSGREDVIIRIRNGKQKTYA
jgi:ParB-like chromosome segregation protein Spo0J